MTGIAQSLLRTDEMRTLVAGLIVDDQANGRFRVNRRAFVDQSIFELERELIFGHCWLYAGHVSELNGPGTFVTRNLGGRRVILTRDKAGEINCFINSCSHRGAVICREKTGKRSSFACPYHGWLYNDVGELIKIPGAERFSEAVRSDKGLGLARAKVDVHCGLIFINFDKDSVALDTYLAGAADIIELITAQGEDGMELCKGMHEYATTANWKLLFENSADGYHAGPTHMSYFEFVQARDGDDLINEAERRNAQTLVGVPSINVGMKRLGNGHSVVETEGPWGRPCARWVPGWGEDTKEEIAEISRKIIARHGEEKGYRITRVDRNTLIFPNLVMNDLMAITIRTFFPVRPDYMEVNAWALGPIGESKKARARRLESFVEFFGPAGFASPDDVEMLALCQQGYGNLDLMEWNDISKGMHEAEFATDDEEQMREFWRKWHAMMKKGLE